VHLKAEKSQNHVENSQIYVVSQKQPSIYYQTRTLQYRNFLSLPARPRLVLPSSRIPSIKFTIVHRSIFTFKSDRIYLYLSFQPQIYILNGLASFSRLKQEEIRCHKPKKSWGFDSLGRKFFVVTGIFLCFSNRVEAGGDQCHQQKKGGVSFQCFQCGRLNRVVTRNLLLLRNSNFVKQTRGCLSPRKFWPEFDASHAGASTAW